MQKKESGEKSEISAESKEKQQETDNSQQKNLSEGEKQQETSHTDVLYSSVTNNQAQPRAPAKENENSKYSSSIEKQQNESKAESSKTTTSQPVQIKKAVNDVVTDAKLTTSSGESVDKVNQYTDMRLNVDFSLPNNTVNEGDTTTIGIPDELKLVEDSDFALKDSNGNTVANAHVDQKSKKITVTYTDFVENHSNVSGSLHVEVMVDTSVVKENKNIPINIDVNGKERYVQNIDYQKSSSNKNEEFAKYHSFDDDKGKTINYGLRINAAGKDYKNVKIKDNLETEGTTYQKGSFKVSKGTWSINDKGSFVLENKQDVTSKVQINVAKDNRSFSVDLGDLNGEGYLIDYKVDSNHQPVDGEIFKNSATMTADNTKSIERHHEATYQKAGGNGEGYNYTINIHKVNEQGQALSGAEFEVIRDSTNEVVGTVTTDSNGNAKVDKLLKDNYRLVETKAPAGYEVSNKTINITPDDFGDSLEVNKEVINSQEEKVSVSGVKTWDDHDNQDGVRPNKITVNLLANGKEVDSQTVSADNDWKYSFKDLAKNENGKAIKYTVKEDAVKGYTAKVDGYNITNAYTPETTSVSGVKTWDDHDNQDGVRPNKITVNLLANGKEVDSQTVSADNDWKYSFKDLAKNENGKAIKYTVKEDAVKGYTAKVDGYNITNTHTPEKPGKPEKPNSKQPPHTPNTATTKNNSPKNKFSGKLTAMLPKTGEQRRQTFIGGSLVILLIALLSILVIRKKRQDYDKK
ncbi:Cna B-type domain-containing protein [Ligilactobacillus acidipiscis]|uniref:Cna B-type domain-containing protein n=1 Tax=Ligilactobacillus acidipiscis TaxID=89059 RepID=UPI0023F6F6F6|nr:Cna B-type domain-containing protein [Ligilactobacillus acidipiscis]WEV58174.1 Cna B-type domain-containing protein [Ligilactobacillus acidipiscis]